MPSPGPNYFAALMNRIREAHDRSLKLRASSGPRGIESWLAHRDLLAAWEEYAEALRVAGCPIPYRVRADMELYRRLVHGARGPGRAGRGPR